MATARKKIEHLWWLESRDVINVKNHALIGGYERVVVATSTELFAIKFSANFLASTSRAWLTLLHVRLSPLLEQLGRARTRPGAARWSFWRRS